MQKGTGFDRLAWQQRMADGITDINAGAIRLRADLAELRERLRTLNAEIDRYEREHPPEAEKPADWFEDRIRR